MASEEGETGVRVSTLELFFDLVFVFTVTQLTSVLAHDFDLEALLQVVLMLGVIWWMYAGYVWLTNAVGTDRAQKRFLLIGGMGAFLVLALSIPEAFESTGLTFGLAYLAVILIHSGMFSRAVEGTIVSVAPYNLAAAALVIAGGIAGGTAQYVIWAVAFAVEWISPWLIDDSGFVIAPTHFAERHGLVVIVAIGESIVAIGIGAAGLAVDFQLVVAAALGLVLSACLWWGYFGGDDERAARALAGFEVRRRPRAAVNAFGFGLLLILLGVVALAAAEKVVIAHVVDPLSSAEALFFAGGLAVFLLGDAIFRAVLRIGRIDVRLGAAALAFVTVPIGIEIAALAQLGALVVLMAATFALEARAAPAWRPA